MYPKCNRKTFSFVLHKGKFYLYDPCVSKTIGGLYRDSADSDMSQSNLD